jgi:hypothetical protein
VKKHQEENMRITSLVEVCGSRINHKQARAIVAQANATGKLYIRDLNRMNPRDSNCQSTVRWDLVCLMEMGLNQRGGLVFDKKGDGVVFSQNWKVALEVSVPPGNYGPDDFVVVGKSRVKELRLLLSTLGQGCSGGPKWDYKRRNSLGRELARRERETEQR